MTEHTESNSYLIVGLGNPGRKYSSDRHNIGFMVLDQLAAAHGEKFRKVQFDALVTKIRLNEAKLLLAKPQIFMNKSGTPVAQLKRYYRVPNSNLIIIFDDLDLPIGQLRLRPRGGSGGHRGMQSIITKISSQEVPRMRLGIGRPPGKMDPSSYVLQSFSEEEQTIVEIQINRAVECIEAFISEGIETAMNRFNE